MGRNCVVEGCPNRKGQPTDKVHRFPTEKNKIRRDCWVERTVTGKLIKVECFGVCSRHFTPSDYATGQVPNLNSRGSKLLLPLAIPTLNLSTIIESQDMLLENQEEMDVDRPLTMAMELGASVEFCNEIQLDEGSRNIEHEFLKLKMENEQLKSEVWQGKSVIESQTITGSVQPDAEDSVMLTSKVLRTLMNTPPEECSSRIVMSESQVNRLDEFDWDIELTEPRSEDMTFSQRAESGGLEYCAGYLAHKFWTDYPQLSSTGLGKVRLPFWVNFLTQVGLTEPSSFWLSTVKKFEELFAILHPELVDKQPMVVKRFYDLLSVNYETLIPDIVLKTYAKFRTLLRIRFLNHQIEDKTYIASEMKRRAFSEMAKSSLQSVDEEEFEYPVDPAQSDLDLIEALLNSYVI